ncbi:unnamed protein product [Arctia plantaginis]|uniref:Uncharacterized protein n=1 Tax=Arctia plantaginis TaxID=874455 RepID=A0A8S1B7N0_ARCPL|nr:unnamed protein product [Arctia plantaginis]
MTIDSTTSSLQQQLAPAWCVRYCKQRDIALKEDRIHIPKISLISRVTGFATIASFIHVSDQTVTAWRTMLFRHWLK